MSRANSQEEYLKKVNQRKYLKQWGALTALCSFQLYLSPMALADDPCDFASSGQLAFSYEQVMACYKTVPFNATDRDNIADVISAHRDGKSTLRNNYDAKINWRANLAAIKAQNYDDDYSMHVAFQDAVIQFKNYHFRYNAPLCYTGALMTYFLPIQFGSTVKNGKQIIFIESNPIRPDLYEEVTGIDTSPLVGQRLVSVDGLDALAFFRQWTRAFHQGDSNDGAALNFVLGGDYSLPFAAKKPNRTSYTYVFESKNKKQTTLELPWVFTQVPSLFQGAPSLPLTSNILKAF